MLLVRARDGVREARVCWCSRYCWEGARWCAGHCWKGVCWCAGLIIL